jgi:hypothetical protein
MLEIGSNPIGTLQFPQTGKDFPQNQGK